MLRLQKYFRIRIHGGSIDFSHLLNSKLKTSRNCENNKDYGL